MLVQSITPNYQNKNYKNTYQTRNQMNNYISDSVSFGTAIPPKNLTNREVRAVLNQMEKLKQALLTKGKNSDSLREIASNMMALTNKVRAKAGFGVIQPTPRMVQTDAYYVHTNFIIHPDAKDHSLYHVAFRRNRLPWMDDLGVKKGDEKFVFYGLTEAINKTLKDPATKAEIAEADRFYARANGGSKVNWDKKMWGDLIKKNHGIIPIKIESLPDGSVVFPGEPIMQIRAGKGFGELAAWFEPNLLQVGVASERASMVRHLLEYNKNLVRNYSDANLTEAQITAIAKKRIVDFSYRSGRTLDESEIMGMATGLSMPTTSTVPAAYRAFKANGDKAVMNLAMPSLPHRVVESYEHEQDAYERLYEYVTEDIKTGFGSFVGDCYDYENAVDKYLLPLALRAKEENARLGRNTIVFPRPDSGDNYIAVKDMTIDKAVAAGLYREITTRSGQVLKGMTTFKPIQANGMTFKEIVSIDNRLIEAGFSPVDCVNYGIGGYLEDAISRSNMSAAQKLAEVGEGVRKRPTMKHPKNEPAKESIPGEVKLVREENPNAPTVRTLNEQGQKAYISRFDGIDGHGVENEELYSAAQRRTDEQFNKYERPKNIFSSGIQDLKDQIKSKHK